MMLSMTADGVLNPQRLWRRSEVVDVRPSPVPRAAGLYAWYFRQVPGGVDTANCHVIDRMPMLYVGMAPKKSYVDGRCSETTLHQRVRYHYTGNAEGYAGRSLLPPRDGPVEPLQQAHSSDTVDLRGASPSVRSRG